MSEYVKVCPQCGKENVATMDFCTDCGQPIKVVIPSKKQAQDKDETLKERYYKICRVCGTKNYLNSKNAFLDVCQNCQNEDINDVPTQMEMAKAPVKKPVIHYILKAEDGKQIEITNGGIIGRYGEIEADYFSQNPYISGEHAKIYKDGNDYYIEDLGSTNGTTVNGAKLFPKLRKRLENNYQICLANLTLVFTSYES